MYFQGSYQREEKLSKTRVWGVWQTSGEVNGELWGSLVYVEVKVPGRSHSLQWLQGCSHSQEQRGHGSGAQLEAALHNTKAGFSGQYMLAV